jgi:D-lactate dehydrogenase
VEQYRMTDVYFYEAFEEEAEAIRAHLPDHMDAGFTWKTIQEAGHDTPPARLVSVRTQSRIPLAWARGLGGLLSRSTGYDHVRRWITSAARSVPCGYLPLYCHRAVAEQALLLWMALLRKLPRQVEQFRAFARDGLTGAEFGGRVLAVVGVGNIGSEVVRIGEALGMEAIGVDLVKRHDFVRYVSIDEALARADVLVCAMNLTPENTGYFHYGRLRRAKRGVVFVNIARGEMSPAADLLRLLEEGRLGGAALDVFEKEDALAVALRGGGGDTAPADAMPVLALSRRTDVILTPHNAFNTKESVGRKAEQSIRQVLHFLERGYFLWPVPDA